MPLIVGLYADMLTHDDDARSTISEIRSLIDPILPRNTIVHLLPVAPHSGDFGFAPDDLCAVRPEVGTWDDLRDWANSRRLILDGIYNHVGNGHPWVQLLEAGKTDVDRRFYVVSLDTAEDLSGEIPCSPRGGSVLQPVANSVRKDLVWRTFTPNGIDLNLTDLEVQEYVHSHLQLLRSNGIWGVRLDAVAYYQKSLRGPIRHVRGVHELASLVASWARAEQLHIFAQLDCDADGMKYFSSPIDRDVVRNDYTFTISHLVALLSGSATRLVEHLKSTAVLGRNLSRSPRTHDGFLLRSSLIDDASRATLGHALATRSSIFMRSEGGSPYELNASGPYLYETLWPGLSRPCINNGVAISAFSSSRPYFYLPHLLAIMPEYEPPDMQLDPIDQNDPRSINRRPIPSSVMAELVQASQSTISLLQVLELIHAEEGALAVNFSQHSRYAADGELCSIQTPSGSHRLLANVSSRPIRVQPAGRSTVLWSQDEEEDKSVTGWLSPFACRIERTHV